MPTPVSEVGQVSTARWIGPLTFRGGTATFQKAERFSQGAAIGATFCGGMKAKISIQCVGFVRDSKAVYKRCRRKRDSAMCTDCEKSVHKHADPKLLEVLKQGVESLKEEPFTICQVENRAEDVYHSILARYDTSLVPCVGIIYEHRDEEIVWKRCGTLRDTGICGACLVRSGEFVRENELQSLQSCIQGTGPASQAALDYACTMSNLILVRRQASMRKKVEVAVVRLSWQALSMSADRWDAALDTDTGLVTQDFKRRVGALRAQEMAELTKFKTKLRLLEATDPNLLCLLHGPDYANSGTIDEHGGLARIAPAAVTIQEVAGDQAPSDANTRTPA